MGSIHLPLPKADLPTCLYALAAFYGEVAERKREAAQNNTINLKPMLIDLNIHLEDSFVLTTEKKVS
jgi:hypothetical protein